MSGRVVRFVMRWWLVVVGCVGCATESCPIPATEPLALVQSAQTNSNRGLVFAQPVGACHLIVVVGGAAHDARNGSYAAIPGTPVSYVSASLPGVTEIPVFDQLSAWELSGLAMPELDGVATHFAPQNQLPTFAGATLTTTRDDELAIAVAMGGGGASAPFIDEPGTSSGVAYAVIPARGTVLAPTWARTSNTQTTDWLITFKSGW